MARIVGLLISGFAVRLYGAGLALYVGWQAAQWIGDTFTMIDRSF